MYFKLSTMIVKEALILSIIEITYIICFFCIGTLFGSFFSLAIYRIPRKQDIMIKRSYCPNCKHELAGQDLIPILSYIFRFGKCKYCKEKISHRYLVLELINGLVFLGVYIVFGNNGITYLILGIYILLFLLVGSIFMKSKMSEQELKEINIKVENNNSKRKGVFNIELLVAMFAFAVYFAAAMYMTRNYRETLLLANMRSLAFNIASNDLQTTKSLKYADISQVNIYNENEVTVDNYGFSKELLINEYVYDNMGPNEKFAKKITSRVTYKYGTKEYEVKLEDIKQKRGDF